MTILADADEYRSPALYLGALLKWQKRKLITAQCDARIVAEV